MWYTASLLFESKINNNRSIWEEAIILVEASSQEEAKRFAQNYGNKEEHEYKNIKGEVVKWSFFQVERVYEINPQDFSTGTELFSRFLRPREVKSILQPFSDNEL